MPICHPLVTAWPRTSTPALVCPSSGRTGWHAVRHAETRFSLRCSECTKHVVARLKEIVDQTEIVVWSALIELSLFSWDHLLSFPSLSFAATPRRVSLLRRWRFAQLVRTWILSLCALRCAACACFWFSCASSYLIADYPGTTVRSPAGFCCVVVTLLQYGLWLVCGWYAVNGRLFAVR